MLRVEHQLMGARSLIPRGGGVYPPPEVISSWPQPNYVDPETHDWAGTIVSIVFLCIAVAVFTARMWSRLGIAKNAGLDDLLITIAMLPLIGTTLATVLGMRIYGFQWHAWDQTKLTYVTSRQLALAIEVNYLAATSLTKISILCFYRRMTNGTIRRKFIYWVWALIAFVVAYFISFSFAILFTCTPVEGNWRLFDMAWRLHNELKCHDEGVIIVVVVVISTLQDFIICALPVFLVWNLQMAKRQKVALIALFGMGLLTCVCGVMRTYFAIYVYYATYDTTWYAYYGWIWTSVEADLGVVCASAPALKFFFCRYFQINRTGYGSTGLLRSDYGKQTTTYVNGSPGNSLKTFDTSTLEHGKGGAMPLDRIQVRTGMNVVVEDREDATSQVSDSSLRNLTILPLPSLSSNDRWPRWGSRTTCERASIHTTRERDVERNAR
ncbi:hypothetical protein P280DRAFT_290946 [Massarina eburnea CBS 473.64]|uniref:Rhodopsin domain-containing protein n=1 Tax=Massarina eburnea CBS 473.64 TaxID=1395130 RepID=A0A6A6S2I7_9PLEO|nr:hypothetical protein P280DRAFT_290946 [Massarina eburnea CBS 473.64]